MEATAEKQEETESARAWPLLALLALGFLAFNAATLLLPHDPYARYQQLLPTIQFRAVWGYERTVFDKTPIDVAVVGNSRLGAGVSAPQLQQQLSAALGREVNVANLSMPQEGQNTHYVIAKRLLEHHPEVKLIILSAIAQMPREGHPAFRNLADARDVVGAPIFLNADYANDLAFLPWRQVSLFVQRLFPETFGIHDFAHSAYDGPAYDTTASFRTPTGNYVDRDAIHSDAELRPEADARAASIDPPQLPESMASYEFAGEWAYTQDIVRLARANGTRVAFLYLPFYAHPMPIQHREFYARQGPVIEASFMAAHPDWYSDYGHLNRRGSQIVTGWLGGVIARSGWIARGDPRG